MSGLPSPAELTLARRLEACDAWGNARSVSALAGLYPDVGAATMPVAGGYAMYAGPDSPLTQAIGLGMDGPAAATEVDRLEEFYRTRDTPVHVEMCPLADQTLHALLAERGYRVEERSCVLARPLSAGEPDGPIASGVQVRIPLREESELWVRTVAAGMTGDGPVPEPVLAFFSTVTRMPGVTCFLGTLDGQPAGGGVLGISDGVAALFGGGTRPPFRNRGVQSALVRARLAFAAAQGCDIAMVITEPGGVSQRNMERQGFRVLYTRSKLLREYDSA
jgi:hypothetical protein